VTEHTPIRLVQAGDASVVAELEARIDPVVNARAVALAEALRSAAIPGVRDVVPTYRTVAVYFDPLRTNYAALVERLHAEAGRCEDVTLEDRQPITVPVCYGGELGPDLPAVAAFAGLSADHVIAIHSGSTYRVFMLGFVPGFAYLGVVDPWIAAPRHATPRVRVPAGSVGIAGLQTGIYPAETPGGWQLIGRTPLKPFDLGRPAPCLFAAGDVVRFAPIDRSEFDRLARSR
jgi:KipI family sensor histidine kinase inhibitor